MLGVCYRHQVIWYNHTEGFSLLLFQYDRWEWTPNLKTLD